MDTSPIRGLNPGSGFSIGRLRNQQQSGNQSQDPADQQAEFEKALEQREDSAAEDSTASPSNKSSQNQVVRRPAQDGDGLMHIDVYA